MSEFGERLSDLFKAIPMGEEEERSHNEFEDYVEEMAAKFGVQTDNKKLFHLIVLALDLANSNYLTSIALTEKYRHPDFAIMESGNKLIVIYLVNMIANMIPIGESEWDEFQETLADDLLKLDKIKLEPYEPKGD